MRAVVAVAFAAWALALALPDCHLFTPAATIHAHIESSGPGVSSQVVPWAAADLHQHAAEPEQHLSPDAMIATLPRSGPSLQELLLVGIASLLVLSMAAYLGIGPRAPPAAALPVGGGRELLIRFGIDRN
ncbi:hypothetical protein FB390_5652 [Nocardia bhagyanarayanae]|uniref:Lipoprotein LpqS n=2 Tax=Nocardia bhagyanarayanae TaxID=1215925 RepID=A0A543EV90_9NOCA|nr:hypothetical protein FB390_5652 [Nocardia bhagyanarayanae]